MAEHNPYVGPRPFTEQEERFFFGRTDEIEILTSLVVARRASLLFAQSGAGKTSLLHAGLTPRLLRHTRIVRDRPVVQPLVRQIRIARVGKGVEEQRPENIFVQSAAISLDPQAAVRVPPDVTLDALLSPWTTPAAATDDEEASLPLLLVFDQFEELFTRHLAFRHQRQDFFLQVSRALETREDLRVLFSMREDYIAELTSFAHLLPDQLRARFRLERLKYDDALEAVRRPAERADVPRPFRSGVAETLCRNLQSGTSDDIEAILLQVACKRLWQGLPEERTEITLEDVETSGNVDTALSDYYRDAVATVVKERAAAEQPISERRIRRFFSQQLLTPSRTRALVFRDEASGLTGGLPNAAIDILSRSDINILRGETRGGSHWYELSHDRLIEPVLRANAEWDETNTTALQKRALEWGAHGRRDQDLLSRLELREIEEWVRGNPDEVLAPMEDEFLTKSRQFLASASARLRVNIEDLGWGIIFAEGDGLRDAIRLALAPLLEHRSKQSGARFPTFEFIVKSGETAQQFLARYGAVTRGTSDSDRIPYYLMIVGFPESIPFEFQYALDAQYAVGRLDLTADTREETLLGYARYARSVVEAESGRWGLPRQTVVFSTLHQHDRMTSFLALTLVNPLLEELRRPDLGLVDWNVAPVVKELATKENLLRLLGGDSRPALLFSDAHGLELTKDDEARQLSEQGGIVCSDWQPGQPLGPDVSVTASDIGDAANLLGMVVFLVGNFGAGTPRTSNRPSNKRVELSARPFVSALGRRLLSHPNGGALAVIGHVDISWLLTFEQFAPSRSSERRFKSEGNTTFLNAVSRLVRGHTVGSAMEFFNTRYTQASADLVDALLNPTDVSEHQRERLMFEAIDVRNYIVLGDPAVRLPIDGPVLTQAPTIQLEASLVSDIDAKLQPAAEAPAKEEAGPAAGPTTPPAVEVVPAAEAPTATVTPVPVSGSFNGIALETGRYFFAPMMLEEFASLAAGRTPEKTENLDESYRAAGSSYFESSSSNEA